MARLMTLCARRLTRTLGPVAVRLHDWPGDIGPAGASLPLRLAGGLHYLARAGDPGLAAAWPPRPAEDEAIWSATCTALDRHAAFLLDWLDSPPQTNEAGRMAALLAMALAAVDAHPLPVEWLEVGASAGLNMHVDRVALSAGGWRRGARPAAIALAPDWTGPPPIDRLVRITSRRGCDIRPVTDPQRLHAYLWPDQPGRAERTDALLALPRPQVDAASADLWLEARLARPAAGRLRVVAHTVAWQYFPTAVATRAAAVIEDAGRRATPEAPLARIAMEADGGRGAGLTLTLWPGGRARAMGRADFHGRWVDWTG